MRDEAMLTARTKLLEELNKAGTGGTWNTVSLKKERRLVQPLWAADEFIKWKH